MMMDETLRGLMERLVEEEPPSGAPVRKIKGKDVFFNGQHVARIIGGRYRWKGAVTPESGFDVLMDGDTRAVSLPYAYFADVVRDIRYGIYDKRFEEVLARHTRAG